MTVTHPGGGEDLRCSVQATRVGDSMLGTAGYDDQYVLVELPLPWPASIEEHPLLAGVRTSSASVGSTRILALASDRPSSVAPNGQVVHRIVSYRGGDGDTFSHFQRHEGFVTADDLVDVINDIVEGDVSDLEPVDDGIVDVLVCTHGVRDRCCGQHGTRLFLELSATEPDLVRLWRTSHTGGHRFAPVAITFPDGYVWGRINAPELVARLDQRIDPSELAERNRGCLGFRDPAAQIADAVALAEFGWDWAGSERTSTVIAVDHDRTEVEIGNDESALVVTVVAGTPVPIAVCGEPLDRSHKTTIPRSVAGVRSANGD
jgi:hypothetical protein